MDDLEQPILPAVNIKGIDSRHGVRAARLAVTRQVNIQGRLGHFSLVDEQMKIGHFPYRPATAESRQIYNSKRWKIARALAKGQMAVYSILRDWIKANVAMVEAGLMSFERVFAGQMLLRDGRTVLAHLETQNLLEHNDEG